MNSHVGILRTQTVSCSAHFPQNSCSTDAKRITALDILDYLILLESKEYPAKKEFGCAGNIVE